MKEDRTKEGKNKRDAGQGKKGRRKRRKKYIYMVHNYKTEKKVQGNSL